MQQEVLAAQRPELWHQVQTWSAVCWVYNCVLSIKLCAECKTVCWVYNGVPSVQLCAECTTVCCQLYCVPLSVQLCATKCTTMPNVQLCAECIQLCTKCTTTCVPSVHLCTECTAVCQLYNFMLRKLIAIGPQNPSLEADHKTSIAEDQTKRKCCDSPEDNTKGAKSPRITGDAANDRDTLSSSLNDLNICGMSQEKPSPSDKSFSADDDANPPESSSSASKYLLALRA